MNKILFLFFLTVVFCCNSQENSKSSVSNQFYSVSNEINQLAKSEDSLYKVMLKSCNILNVDLDKMLKQYAQKKSTIDTFLLAENSIRITDDKVKNLSLSDASRMLNFSIRYNALEMVRLKIYECQNKLENKQSWILGQVDSLRGAYRVIYKGTTYDLYITDLKDQEIALHDKKKGSLSLKNVKDKLESKKREVKMITNAGMYTPKCDPEGLYISEGKEQFPLDTGSSEITLNFYMHPNGVFFVDTIGKAQIVTTDNFKKLTESELGQISLATQSGPMLLVDGEIHHKFNRFSKSKKKRSGVGVFGNKVVFAITEGRTNFFSFASFFQDYFNCPNALFLDGTISLMYLKEGRVNNLGGAFGPVISISE